jgi:hypothetical protein
MQADAEQRQHLLRSHRISGRQTVDPGQPGADPNTRCLTRRDDRRDRTTTRSRRPACAWDAARLAACTHLVALVALLVRRIGRLC